MIKKNIKNKKGFTIIEMMIAIALFLVIVIYGMQSLLNASLVHKKTQDVRSILDSLTFTLDDMSKNLRVGSNYHCIEDDIDFNNLDEPKSCESGSGISFMPADISGSSTWVYLIYDGHIYKNTQPSSGFDITEYIQLTPEEVTIENISGFSVLGAESPIDGDNQQPLVIIKLIGTINRNNVSTPFSIETAVSQRLIDVSSSLSGPFAEPLPTEQAPAGTPAEMSQTTETNSEQADSASQEAENMSEATDSASQATQATSQSSI